MVITKFHKPIVTVEWLHNNMHATNLIILDASIPKAVDKSDTTVRFCIPGARFFDLKHKFSDLSAQFPNTFPSLEQFEREAQKLGINNDSFIVVYDDKGIYSSPRAWWLFKAYGFSNIAVLDGGLPAWTEAYYPLAKKESNHNFNGNFKAQLQDGFMMFFDDLKVISQSQNHHIVDARSENRFNGLEPEPREGLRSGHIPNSKNIPYTELLNGNKLKPTAAIENIFDAVLSEQKPITFSCGSGITACILALGATLINYKDLSVYDGSWTEWGTLTDE